MTSTFDPARHMPNAVRQSDANITTLSAASGNPYIDGLTLEPGQTTPVIYTPGSTIRYFFDTDARPWTEVEQAAVRSAWEAWDRLINLNIEETTEREQATVLMQVSALPEDAAAEATAPVDGVVPATNKTNVNGNALQFIDLGGDSYLTLLHEIGHNLGFYHPHNDTTFPGIADGEEQNKGTVGANQHVYTVMGYVIGWDQQPVQNLSFGAAMTPMALDIAAAQFAYGAAAANTGDDTYSVPTQNQVGTGWTAIWDTGGTDTISAQAATQDTTIDLRAATLEGNTPGGHVSWTGGIVGGFTIAQGVTIENAVGGSGNDTLIGNAANNALTGGGGNDTLTGGDGADTAHYNTVNAGHTVSISQNGSVLVTDRNGQNGTDTLQGVERVQFSDRTLDFNQFNSTANLSSSQFTELAEMYTAYFNRAADATGLYFWADALAEGLSLNQIAEFFFDQDETRSIYTDPNDTTAFVTSVYDNVLGRTPDQGGFDFWAGAVGSGAVSQGAFVLEIIRGAKAGTSQADVEYLTNKANLGVYFSAIQGMSDVADARSVFTTFGDQATSNLAGARAEIDAHFADATAAGGGDFLFTLVGVVDDPFANVA